MVSQDVVDFLCPLVETEQRQAGMRQAKDGFVWDDLRGEHPHIRHVCHSDSDL